MTLAIELTPEQEARLRSEAAGRGLDPEQYALQLLGRALSEAPADDTGEWEALAEEVGRSWPDNVSVSDVLSGMRR